MHGHGLSGEQQHQQCARHNIQSYIIVTYRNRAADRRQRRRQRDPGCRHRHYNILYAQCQRARALQMYCGMNKKKIYSTILSRTTRHSDGALLLLCSGCAFACAYGTHSAAFSTRFHKFCSIILLLSLSFSIHLGNVIEEC